MAGDFFPRREGELVRWAAVLSRTVLAAPEDYAVPLAMAESLALASAAFADAYRRANEPSTATRPAVQAKNAAKRELIHKARLVNRLVASRRGLPPARVLALGLNPRGPGGRQTPLPRPESSPLLVIEKAEGHMVHVRILRKSGGNPHARPAGVQGALVYRAIGPEPAGGRLEWKFVKGTGARRLAVEFPDDVPPGTQVWITARWVTVRGLTGPGAAAVTVNLPGGATLLKPPQLIAA